MADYKLETVTKTGSEKGLTRYIVTTPDGRQSQEFVSEEVALAWKEQDILNQIEKKKKEKYDSLSKIGKAEFNITNPDSTFQAGYQGSAQAFKDSTTLADLGGDYLKYTPLSLKDPDWKIKYDKMSDLNKAHYRYNNTANFPNYSEAQKEADAKLLYQKTGDQKYITDIVQKGIDDKALLDKRKAYTDFDVGKTIDAIETGNRLIELHTNPDGTPKQGKEALVARYRNKVNNLTLMLEEHDYYLEGKELPQGRKRLIY